MKTWLPLCLIVTASLVFADETSRQKWQGKLTMLTNGMTRAQVEHIFPDAGNNCWIFGTGGGYTIKYNIDDETAISLAYDYTGYQTNAEGRTINEKNPSNCLRRVDGLIDQENPPPIRMGPPRR